MSSGRIFSLGVGDDDTLEAELHRPRSERKWPAADARDAPVETPIAVLYLHGLGSSRGGEKATRFRRSMTTAGFAFCSFDFRGHGGSGGSMFDLSLSRSLEDVAAVRQELERLGYRRLVLLGSSFGGLTGLWHARRQPDGVAAAVHLAPAIGLEKSFAAQMGAEAVERCRREGRFTVEHELGRWEIGWQFVDDLRRHPVEELAARYRTPTLLLQGQEDASVPWQGVANFSAACTAGSVELHLFAGADHRMVDLLETLATLTREFLARPGLLDP